MSPNDLVNKLLAVAEEAGYTLQLTPGMLEAIPVEPLPEWLVYHRNKAGKIEGYSEAANSPLAALQRVHQALGYTHDRQGRLKPAPVVAIVK